MYTPDTLPVEPWQITCIASTIVFIFVFLSVQYFKDKKRSNVE